MRREFRLTPRALDLIRRYARDRLNAERIGRLLNCSAGTIETICNKHGIELAKADDAPLKRKLVQPDVVVDVPINAKAMELIRSEALRRGWKASTLISRVAEIVATDQIFGAVIDK